MPQQLPPGYRAATVDERSAGRVDAFACRHCGLALARYGLAAEHQRWCGAPERDGAEDRTPPIWLVKE